MPPTVPDSATGPATTGPVTTGASVCPLDCPDTCSLAVTLEAGRVVALEGSRTNPYTAGVMCKKVRRFPEHLYGPERLLHPQVRVGRKGEASFRRASWDEALDLVAARLASARDEHGGESILPLCYGGSNGQLSHGTLDERLFRRLGASRLARTLCAAATGAATAGLYGRMPGVALPDYEHARLIVVWGQNPHVSGIHFLPVIKRARAQGALLVVVDPRRTRLAAQADLHLALRPGTDLPLALAVIRRLFVAGGADAAFLAAHTTGADEPRRRAEPWTPARAAEVCGVPEEHVARFAALWAERSPAVVRCGWGPERNRNGGSAIAAILALPAVAGKFGVRGGGYTMSNSPSIPLRDVSGAQPPATRLVNMNQVGRVLLEGDPAVRVLFAYDCNPLATLPEQTLVRRGLERDDLFTVVFEQALTDTARYADVLLPATTFLEHTELKRSYGAIALQRSDPVVPPVGEARSNVAVFGELCRRLGLQRDDEPSEPDALIDALLGPDAEGRRLARDLAEHGIAYPLAGPAPIPFVDVFPGTPDRKVHLAPEALDREAPAGLYGFRELPVDPAFPLALISPAHDRAISSSLGQLVREQVPLRLHPDDAAARGLREGDEVRAWNALGEVRCLLALDDALRPGVACLYKGLWAHNTRCGSSLNALSPDTLTDLGGGACFNDARIEVARA